MVESRCKHRSTSNVNGYSDRLPCPTNLTIGDLDDAVGTGCYSSELLVFAARMSFEFGSSGTISFRTRSV